MEASKATIYTPEISHNGHRYRLAVITCPDSGDQYLETQRRPPPSPGPWPNEEHPDTIAWRATWTRQGGVNCNVLEATILAMLERDKVFKPGDLVKVTRPTNPRAGVIVEPFILDGFGAAWVVRCSSGREIAEKETELRHTVDAE
jgi:hypothetical protein